MRPAAGADELLDLFRQLREKAEKAAQAADSAKPADDSAAPEPEIQLVRAFRFYDLADAVRAARALGGFYQGENLLAKDAQSGGYDLVLHQSGCTPESFNKVCNILSEFGESRTFSAAANAHLLEHGDILLAENAVALLAEE